MEDELLDVRLKELVLAAQKHPALTLERKQALNKLVKEIVNSGKLWHSQVDQFHQNVYDDALQDLLVYLCGNIEKYNPAQGPLLSWLKMLMKKRFFSEAMAKTLEQPFNKVSLQSVADNFFLQENVDSLVDKIKICIELDPEDIFKNKHIEKHPNANFQALFKLRFNRKTWSEISTIMKLSSSTLNNFYLRSLKEFKLKIKRYLELYC